jgi:hypothetical protein
MKNKDGTIRKRRAMTTEQARRVKLAGHEAEKEFADLIGGYKYPGSKKKDVVDNQGNVHSIKSGDKKWQIFLYGRNRFETSIGFLGAKLFLDCINSFPAKRNDYLKNKETFKISLQKPMNNLREFLLKTENTPYFLHGTKIIFLQEALFHSSEVDYLTIKEDSVFHIFDSGEVIRVIDDSVGIFNSKAEQSGQMNDQKVVFRLHDGGTTIGEIEMRNDSDVHYREIKFWMDREKTLDLLRSKITTKKQVSDKIVTYGKAKTRFKLV